MIFRLLLLFLVVWFLFWLIKKQFSDENPSVSEKKTDKVEDMIACNYCGTHVPKSLGVQSGTDFYCCEQHAEQDKAENNKTNK